MHRKIKQKAGFTKSKATVLLILTLIMLVNTCAPKISQVHATQISSQEKGLTILNDVVGLDLTKYTTTPKEYPLDSYLGVVPKENIGYTLQSNTSQVDLLCTFVEGELCILHVLEVDGSPYMTRSAESLLNTTKDMLNGYQTYLGNGFYGELTLMLNEVIADKNSTVTSGNVKLDVTLSENSATFTWSYTFDGVDAASKCVSIGYKNGFLKHFIDTWELYEIGSTKVALSEEEAIEIAMEQAKAYTWDVVVDNETVEVNNFNITATLVKQLVFCNSLNTDNIRSEDCLTLYPMWRIGVGLDKYYPGNVYGIYVDVWADTGQIRDVQEAFSTLDPPTDEIANFTESTIEKTVGQEVHSGQLDLFLFVFMVFATLTFGSFFVWLRLGEKKLFGCCRLPKSRFFKIYGMLLCLAVLLAMLLFPISTANAYSLTGRATIWGSLAEPKTPGELSKQDAVCQYIDSQFSSRGYNSSDFQGSYTLKENALSSIESDEENYNRVATVWFDHGIGECLPLGSGHENEWHFMLCDSSTPSDHLYDYEIYEKTELGKTYFAFINTCLSAKLDLIDPLTGEPLGSGRYGDNNGLPIGMPYAWTHGAYLSTTGYTDPDPYGSYCYIGFPWGSAALDQYLDEDYPSIKYYDWVWDFFDYVLTYGLSVNQALDHASYECFPPQYFGDTALYNGFIAIWPRVGDMPDCTMEVYGNGDLCLCYSVEVRAYDQYSNPVSAQVVVDGKAEGYTGNSFWVAPGTHRVVVAPYPSAYTSFSHFGGYPSGQNPITVDVSSDQLLWAYYEYNSTPAQHTLTVCGSSLVYPIAATVAAEFKDYYNCHSYEYPIGYVEVFVDNDADTFFRVRDGIYDVGMMSRLPSSEEWAGFPEAQVWAVAYTGNLSKTFEVSKVL